MTSAPPPLLVAMSGGKPRLRRARVPAPKESKLHVAIADTLRDHCLPNWKWRHLSSKAKDAREGAILKRMGVNSGWFDFILVSPYGTVRFLETKRAGENLTSGQEEFRMWCIRCGILYAVVWTIDQALTVLTEWHCLRIELPKRGSMQG